MKHEEMDFSRVCRTCKNDYTDTCLLFSFDTKIGEEHLRIDEMLMACASVQVSCEDELPKSVCYTCVQQLQKAFNFKLLCERTDASLRQHIKNLKENCQIKIEEVIIEEAQSSFSCVFEDLVKREEGCVKDETESLSGSCEVAENNATLLSCSMCLEAFTTLTDLQCHKCMALFKCKQCDKEYKRLDRLQKHELSHSRSKVYVCKICKATQTTPDRRHLMLHLKEKPFRCQTCNRSFSRAYYLENHMNQCNGEKIHVCDICNRGFKRENVLEVHKTQVHGDQKPILKILDNLQNIEEHYDELDVDNATFSSSSDLEDLEDGSECIKPEVVIVESKKVENVMPAVYAEEKPQEILEDKVMFLNEGEDTENKQTHFEITSGEDSDSAQSEYLPEKASVLKIKSQPKEKTVEEYTCPECSLVFPKMSVLEKHAQIHDGLKLHNCDTCEKKFTRAEYLKRHMLNHSTVKPFVCNICTRSFIRSDHLRAHKKLHSRTKDYECAICKRLFFTSEILAKHMTSKHSAGKSEKKFKCSVCMKGFTIEKYRDFHLKTHTNDRKFHCKTCNKAYISKSHLTQHMKLHNDDSKKFLCSDCGQRFIRKEYLIIHMRRHRGEKPFKCKYCGQGFPRFTDLTCHELRHTGEKKHVCTTCGKGFGRAYSLTVHMRTHTGEKPYQCTYCKATFSQGNNLKTHIRRHTGEGIQCDMCPKNFYLRYQLIQHKRSTHGGNVARLEPVKLNQSNSDVFVHEAALDKQIQNQVSDTSQLQE